MSKPIRVLLIEDSVNDARLLERELKRNGYDPVVERVDTPQMMREHLAGESWDIILSDYGMPAFSAQEALALLKETGLDIPFIIVSGTIGESRAVEAMRSGAHDYVMKDNLSRLGPAIDREIQEAQVRALRARAEASIRESEERFRSMADSAPALIWLADTDANFYYVNKPWVNFTGSTYAGELGSAWMSRIHPADLAATVGKFRSSFAARTPFDCESRLKRHDGEWRWMLIQGTPRFLSDGAFAGYCGICIDLTERHRAEQEREQMRIENERLLLENADNADRQRKFLREVLYSVTEGRLVLCDGGGCLPEALEPCSPSINLSAFALRELRRTADAAGEAAGIPELSRYDLMTAVSEAGMNAVVHGGGGEAYVCLGADRVQAWIIDRGSGIDIERIPRATLERGYSTANTLGHGFFMMLAGADRVYLLTGPNGTTVVIEKYRNPPVPEWMRCDDDSALAS